VFEICDTKINRNDIHSFSSWGSDVDLARMSRPHERGTNSNHRSVIANVCCLCPACGSCDGGHRCWRLRNLVPYILRLQDPRMKVPCSRRTHTPDSSEGRNQVSSGGQAFGRITEFVGTKARRVGNQTEAKQGADDGIRSVSSCYSSETDRFCYVGSLTVCAGQD